MLLFQRHQICIGGDFGNAEGHQHWPSQSHFAGQGKHQNVNATPFEHTSRFVAAASCKIRGRLQLPLFLAIAGAATTPPWSSSPKEADS